MEGVTRMIWNKGHILNHLEVQGVADLQVLPFHGQCESGGCGRSCSVAINLILHSSTISCGGSELLSWKMKWSPSLITVPSSAAELFGGADQRLGL